MNWFWKGRAGPLLIGPSRIVHRRYVVRAEGQQGLAGEAELSAVLPVLDLVSPISIFRLERSFTSRDDRSAATFAFVEVGAGETVVRQLMQGHAVLPSRPGPAGSEGRSTSQTVVGRTGR